MYRKYLKEHDTQTQYLKEHESKAQKIIDKTEKIVGKTWEEVERQCNLYKPPGSQTLWPTGWKEIRVFVSSTFTDFFNEREILVKKVFPELREWCRTRHIHLIDYDLRWGVPKEATSQDVIVTCLAELDWCHIQTDDQPFFLGLIGNRYGWIPSKTDLSEDLRQKFQWVDNTSITFMEMLHGAYRCKSPNAVFFLRSDDVIKALPQQHVKRFVDEDETQISQLKEFKKRLRRRFPDQTYEYNCKVDGVKDIGGREQVKLTELDKFAEQAMEFFKTAISNMYGEEICNTDHDEDDTEKENQRLFMIDKSEQVIGQEQLMKTFKSYIKGEPLPGIEISEQSKACVRDPKFWCGTKEEDNMILCITGPPGHGKSTIIAKLVRDITKEGRDIFYHFVGCEASSKSTEFMYSRLLKALEKKVIGTDQSSIVKGMTVTEMMDKMKALLPKLREQKTELIIIIDAVNELSESDSYNHMAWLPPRFPGNIKCIISSADDSPPTIARLAEHPCYMCQVEPISKEVAEEMVTTSLRNFKKRLDEEQLSMIVSSPCATNPLWLKILTEELRVFGDFRLLNKKIDKISGSVESLITDIIERLILEDDTGVVKKTLCLLACSIGGVKTEDMCNMLGNVGNKEPVAPLYWTQARRVLKPYIKEVGVEANLSFYHMEIYKSLCKVMFENSSSRIEWYKILAEYFTKWCPDDISRANYAPTYCINANMKSELVDFFDNDKAARHISDWKRSEYLQKIRCQFPAIPIMSQYFSVVLCQFCSSKTHGIFRTRNQDSCVVCKGRLHFNNEDAILCSNHAFGHSDKVGRCLYCGMNVPKERYIIKQHCGTMGKLCNHCGFGNRSKICAMLLKK